MATGPTTECLPCVFGAVESTIIAFDVVTVDVVVNPIVQVRNGSTVTLGSSTTSLTGDTPFATTLPGQTIIDITGSLYPTLGTTLTFPNTYVQYLGFEGAGVSPALTACAQTIEPTAVSVPQGEPLSYLFLFDNSPQLPVALLDYLDANGVPEQLAGNQLTTCSPLPSVSVIQPSSTQPPSTTSAPLAPTTSSPASTSPTASLTSPSTATPVSESTDVTTLTSTLTTSTTVVRTSSFLSETVVETTLPPPTTFTTNTPVTIITSQVEATTSAITRRIVRSIRQFTGAPIVTTAQNLPVVAPSITESVSPTAAATRVTTSPTVNLGILFSALFASTSPASSPISLDIGTVPISPTETTTVVITSTSSIVSGVLVSTSPASSPISLVSETVPISPTETTTVLITSTSSTVSGVLVSTSPASSPISLVSEIVPISPTETTTVVITSTSSIVSVVTTGFENNATGSMTTLMGVGPVGSGTGVVPVGNGSLPSVAPFPGAAAKGGARVVLGVMVALVAGALPMMLLL